jgi:hypothetical protein
VNRVYDFDDVMPLRRKTAASVMARLAERKKGVAGNRRPRSEDERAMIVRMALVHVRQRRESGELVEVAPRLYELRTGSRER